MNQYKKQLFDKEIVTKIVAASITLYLLQENDIVNENVLSKFVIKNIDEIIESVTNE